MANIAFGSKYFIFSRFSSIPKTSRIEQERAALKKELEDFEAFKTSDELIEFEALGKYLSSDEHKTLMAKIRKDIAGEQQKEKDYESQKKSARFKTYFKMKNSSKLADFKRVSESEDLKRLSDLEKEINATEFRTKKQHLESAIRERKSRPKKEKTEKSQKELEEIQQELGKLVGTEKEYLALRKSRPIKSYFKFRDSQKYKNFQAFEKSRELADYTELETYLKSEERAEKLKKLKAQEEAENNKINSHEEFKNSKKYQWYLKVKDSNNFDELKKWNVIFEDDFSSDSLDTSKWMTRYYWGDKLMNDAYALDHDLAYPTDGKNIELKNALKIVTRKEKIEGKKWKLPFGFIPQEFEYTTGLVSTAKSFRMKYGKVEAKIRVNYAKPVNYNFWMASEQNLPHVDILKVQKKKTRVDVGHAYGNIADEKGPSRTNADFSGLDIAQDYFIYTLEWTKDKLTWKINDTIVNEQTQGIPQEEMYLVFSSAITENTSGAGLPASMEVDWVRCYQAE